ncbi:ABC-F family ATP-binding cassette domain-containing protein [Campylobacter lari]|uniref:ABC-F family ATP-binding cassette domain-containing protein n=1 Tax=Campylobacter sp. CNRCH_2014_2452 TaxID=2911603 RepID=UPI00127369AB|nr:ABC-F family ATP-binding cassette domain-containing protein [Campylobacter sp. CNRCH_2014_2452]EAK0818304.1 ABC-F family ATP-binding cassette domain-containing protein [Campylobacter lari]EAK9891022.1 ABC-F family ATP-binding cassette domain-containing protein [Campylobacter lari]EGK8025444.1 ABC-F family ATP-binding cassette domain-containing protein [Campylobacter lari]EGK8129885.1 ABC-F family ATP-binding cassette domain-containing protein [Campylobacter lari]MCV3486153.1 ABC-F family AT
MALIDLIDANKKFNTKIVLENANFSANLGEKIAIIGKNGEGKSSFLKALMGTLRLDSGRVIKQNNTSIGMLSQQVSFESTLSVSEAIKKELEEIYQALKEFESYNEKLAFDPENKEYLKKVDELSLFIDSKDAWNLDQKIQRILEEFKLLEYKDRTLCSLSGGEIRRVGLCTLLLKNPDILLLDEPTNHLDVYMSNFLEERLKTSKMCVIFISHDRYFIDAIAQKCVEIEAGKLSIFEGGYTQYLEKKVAILASLAKSHETLLKQLKSEEEWLRRGVKARLKRNEGRKERIFKMREEAKKNPGAIKRLQLEIKRASKNFNQTQSQNRKKMLFELKNISKSIANKTLFKDFNARILQGERIAIVGKNGCGKSTFLKILLDQIPLDSGEIKRGEVKIGYFDQSRSLLNTDKKLLEIFCPNGGDHIQVRGKNMHVYGYLKQFLFPKEFLEQSVSVLSGGEKNRVALALLFTKEYDVLILDEPTNDLDIATINILEEYLLSFEGAILLVSHDRYFVDKIATKLYAFEDNANINIEVLSYSEYLENEKEYKDFEEFSKSLETNTTTSVKTKEKSSKKLSYKENEILNSYPDKIHKLEEEIKEIKNALSNPAIYQELGINTLYEKLNSLENELSILEEAYFEVLEKSENID